MKRLIPICLILALGLGLQAVEVKVETRTMEKGVTGNQKFPVVAENLFGEQLYVFRSNDRHPHYYYYENGKWTGGGRIPGSPTFDKYWFSDLVADSTGAFHFVAEEADNDMYYASFKNGAWTSMRIIDVKHEATLALGVRSNDTVVLVAPRVGRTSKGELTKDVLVGTKPVDKTNFAGFENVTNDRESSTMVDVAIDAKDNSWIVYKGAFFEGGGENMQAVLLVLNKFNNKIYFRNVSNLGDVYCWYSQVGINSDGKVMVTWFTSQHQLYYSRLYDPAANKWSHNQSIMPGPRRPWPTMYNKILTRGSDFYWVGLTPNRHVLLYKYHEGSNSWTKFADISDVAANWVSACMGADSILISWDSMKEPTSCYLTTVTGDFLPPVIRIQSVSNLVVKSQAERSFFHEYFMNILTWEANPLNESQGITIASHRIYRKPRTADSSQWTQIAEVASNVFTYQDRDVTADSDYVYAVTCVDTNGAESPLVDPTEETSGTRSLPGLEIPSSRADR